MDSTSASLRSSFVCEKKFESFYSGGKVDYLPLTNELVCCCGEDVVVVDVESGTERKRLAGDTRVLTFSLDANKERGWLVVSYLNLQLKTLGNRKGF